MSTPATAMALENVLYEKKGAIAYVTLNRPKVLNALNQRTWEELEAAFEDARDDADVRGVILTGAATRRSSPEPTSANWLTSPPSRRSNRARSDRKSSTSSRISASR